jgi:hypothetical protein
MLWSTSQQECFEKRRKTMLKQRAAAQEHLFDPRHMVGHPTPARYDPIGKRWRRIVVR